MLCCVCGEERAVWKVGVCSGVPGVGEKDDAGSGLDDCSIVQAENAKRQTKSQGRKKEDLFKTADMMICYPANIPA